MKSSFFARRGKKASAEGLSPLQELEVSPCSRLYLLVCLNGSKVTVILSDLAKLHRGWTATTGIPRLVLGLSSLFAWTGFLQGTIMICSFCGLKLLASSTVLLMENCKIIVSCFYGRCL